LPDTPTPPRPVLVSACLLGLATRYDGRSKTNTRVLAYLRARNLLPIPVCPEQLGGLATPRPPARFHSGDGEGLWLGQGELVNQEGKSMNAAFKRGAEETLRIARLNGCGAAILKERSPSCGVHRIHRREGLTAGSGVAAALLRQAGLSLISDEDL
jgi:uncharacterized protein YbbK (DUF523 family)